MWQISKKQHYRGKPHSKARMVWQDTVQFKQSYRHGGMEAQDAEKAKERNVARKGKQYGG